MSRFLSRTLILVALASLFAYNSEQAAPEEAAEAPAAPEEGAPTAGEPETAPAEPELPEAPHGQPLPPGEGPDLPRAAALGQPFTGSIVDTMDSAGYTYMLVDTGEAQVWVAAGQISVAVGDEVNVGSGTLMRSFYSRTLDRTFEAIVFASEVSGGSDASALPEGHPVPSPVVPEGQTGHDAPTTLPSGHPPIGGEAPAEGATTE